MSSPWKAILAGLGGGARTIGQNIKDEEEQRRRDALLKVQQDRQQAQDALSLLTSIAPLGGRVIPPGADPTGILTKATQFNNMASGQNEEGTGPSAIPNSALGISEDQTPNAFGSPYLQKVGQSNVLIDPSQSREAGIERRASLAQLAAERRQREMQAALDARQEAKSVADLARQKELQEALFKQQKELQASAYRPDQRPKYGAFIDPNDPTKSVKFIPEDEASRLGLVPAERPGAGSSGSAQIKMKVASNRTQVATINDALAELDKHPEAVGIIRGAGETINQRVDQAGVAARASLANVGSLKIHDRSGAAVTAAESPRLMPFIPRVTDNVDVARVKLKKLAEQIEIETRLLEQSTNPAGAVPEVPVVGGGGRGGGRGSGSITLPPNNDGRTTANQSADPEFDALMAKAKKRKP